MNDSNPLSNETWSAVFEDYDGCRLCWALEEGELTFAVNSKLAAIGDFVILPALGSFRPGYSLLVANDHLLGLSHWPDKGTRLIETIAELKKLLLGIHDDWLLFEHSTSKKTVGSCCIDHFHIHLFPLRGDEFERLSESLGRANLTLGTVPNYSKLAKIGEPYVAIGTTRSEEIRTYQGGNIPSQWVRRELAAIISTAAWNWRTPFPQDEEITAATIAMFGPAKSDTLS